MKKMLLATILFLILLFSMNVYGGGFNPPPGTERLSGPAIVGTLQLSVVTERKVNGMFVGNCKGQPLGLILEDYDINKPFNEVEKDDLINIRMLDTADFLPPGCFPKDGPQPLIINTVSKFSNDGSQILADIVLLFVLFK